MTRPGYKYFGLARSGPSHKPKRLLIRTQSVPFANQAQFQLCEVRIVEIVNKLLSTRPSRRSFLASAGAASVSALVAGCSDSGSSNVNPTPPVVTPVTDADILTFALNLEYLEAEFYLRAVTGSGLSSADGSGTVTGGTKVPFKTTAFAAYAAEIAKNELDHVRAIRATLQSKGTTPITAPAIDFTAAFAAAATAAGITTASPFNPFADETSFLLGSFLFEDVGVTAYTGAASLITDKGILSAAAGIQAVEAYHAGELRTIIANIGGDALTNANKISALRGTLGGGAEVTLSLGSATTASTIAAADGTGLAYGRSVDQVLHIVYATGGGAGVSSGGFFPSGLNGNIKTTAS